MADKHTIPKGQRAMDLLPPDVRPLIASIADEARGGPWIKAYHAARDLAKFATSVGEGDFTLTDIARRIMITALLQGLKADPGKCTDPFQSSVYANSARKDFRRSARLYVNKIGGPAAVEAEMTEWVQAHKDEAQQWGEDRMVISGGENDEDRGNRGNGL